jgi:GNAT superfamily N-acetyltransferase
VEIRFLAEAPTHADTLARWHHAEWGDLYTDWSLDDARAELHDHATRRTRPTTLVALEHGELLGSVSLVDSDAPELDALGDAWLASLYVVPKARGRGLGAALVRALIAHAAVQRIDRLWLFTPEHAGFYARLGWNEAGRTHLGRTPVTVMHVVPTHGIAAA